MGVGTESCFTCLWILITGVWYGKMTSLTLWDSQRRSWPVLKSQISKESHNLNYEISQDWPEAGSRSCLGTFFGVLIDEHCSERCTWALKYDSIHNPKPFENSTPSTYWCTYIGWTKSVLCEPFWFLLNNTFGYKRKLIDSFLILPVYLQALMALK